MNILEALHSIKKCRRYKTALNTDRKIASILSALKTAHDGAKALHAAWKDEQAAENLTRVISSLETDIFYMQNVAEISASDLEEEERVWRKQNLNAVASTDDVVDALGFIATHLQDSTKQEIAYSLQFLAKCLKGEKEE